MRNLRTQFAERNKDRRLNMTHLKSHPQLLYLLLAPIKPILTSRTAHIPITYSYSCTRPRSSNTNVMLISKHTIKPDPAAFHVSIQHPQNTNVVN